jgi:hypothetical protein
MELFLCQHARAVVYHLGPYLQDWLIACVYFQLVGELPPTRPIRARHFLPDNPMVRLADGTILNADLAHPHHFEQFAEWKRSLLPQRKPGPKKFSGEFSNREAFIVWLDRLVRVYYEEKRRAPSVRELAIFTEYSRSIEKTYPKKIYRYCRKFTVDYDEVVRQVLVEMSRPEHPSR